MKFSSALLQNVLFASAVLAAPKGYGLANRIQRRAARHLSHPLILAEGTAPAVAGGGVSNVQYSTNWAGAVITSPPSGETFNNVVGTFTVPTPSAPSGSSDGSYSASAWVGIDGDTYGNAILQAGIDFTYEDGDVSYDAWYEWYPDYAYDFSGISLSAGDVITVTIHASSLSKGKVTINNESTGETVSKSLKAPSSSSDLGGQNAEWIVEDFDSGGSEVAFADFGSVTFTGCSASTASSTEGLDSAIVIDIKQDSQVLTSVTIESSSEVVISYA